MSSTGPCPLLRRAGKFRDIQAVVIGEMPGCGLSAPPAEALHDVILDAFADQDIPIVFGVRAGHNTGKCLTLPLGVRVRLDAGDTVTLTLLEAAVRPPNKRPRKGK